MTKRITMKAIGKKEFEMLQHGQKVGLAGICKAKCYECMGFYDSGVEDCNIVSCPIYSRMPYRGISLKEKTKSIQPVGGV